MRWTRPQLMIWTLLLSLCSVQCHSRRNVVEEEEEAVNICNIKDPKVLFCYCDKLTFYEATEGNCWIFHDTSMEEYADIWEEFSSQSHIKQLTLHLRTDGTVRRIPTIAFRHLPEIEGFEIQYATIDSIHSFAFANSSTMQEVLLARNSIKELEPFAFANMKNLTKITLEENLLTEIKREVFVNLPKLSHLFIEQNNITQVADYAFHMLHSLVELEMFSNQIKVIVPNTFIGLEKLVRLDLSRNHFEVIGDRTFQHLKSLSSLYLQHNSIKFIAPKGFAGLSKLRKLKLEDNKLLTLGSDIFTTSKMLSYIDLSHNVLETVEEDAFYPLKTMLAKEGMILVLKGNLIRCDTRVKWLFDLYNDTKSRIIRDALDELHCFLESGSLPNRFDPQPTQSFEVTTLGIGPRVKLMKLRQNELPEPLLKTQATLTSEDCEEDETQKKPMKPKKSKKQRKPKMNEPPTIVENHDSQNDMAVEEKTLSEPSTSKAVEVVPSILLYLTAFLMFLHC